MTDVAETTAKRPPLSTEYPFLVTFGLIAAIAVVRFPSATLWAEPYAETGREYFLHALQNPFLTSVLLPDFTHRPYLSRLIATAAVQLLGLREWYAVTVQTATGLLCALAASTIALSRFRPLVSSDLLRSVLALAIGTHWGWGMYLLHNLGYWSAPIGFLLCLSFAPIGISALPLLVFAAALLPGKAYSLAFLPILLWRAAYGARRRRPADLLCYGVIIGALSTIAFVQMTGVPPAAPLSRLFGNSTYFLFYLPSHLFFGALLPIQAGPAVALVGWVLVLVALAIAVIRRDTVATSAAPLGGVLAAVTIAMTVRGFYVDSVDWSHAPSFNDDSHFFFPSVALWLGTGTVIARSLSTMKALTLLATVTCTSGVFGFLSPRDPYTDPSKSASEWAAYSRLTRNDRFCIPINPPGWYAMKDCDHLRDVPGTPLDRTTIRYGAGGLAIAAQWLGDATLSPSRLNAILPDGRTVRFRKASNSVTMNPLYLPDQPTLLPFDVRARFWRDGNNPERALEPGSLLLFGAQERR